MNEERLREIIREELELHHQAYPCFAETVALCDYENDMEKKDKRFWFVVYFSCAVFGFLVVYNATALFVLLLGK
ncbi:hypothetical protein O0555_21100 [Brevibacillus laterosporus]|uniref:hypothetical protein n=1 Tax=Brevibacillus laterosporus TaxID=1465 RepID=UPI00215D0FA2|nr:hypothetical protein [Brevibacillus laterosporus]MCR8939801.1 hypothetical protein [Brevibacillus laterosporus]MCZ0842441.1 hypothetical protein [Brevibacillus laterosporus]MCZ0846438.1 hypothetical protein [Brevibacillus laterosporus]